MPSSISSSRTNAVLCLALFVFLTGLGLGFDNGVTLSFDAERESVRQRLWLAHPSPRPLSETESLEGLAHDLLARAPSPSLVFIGNSVVQTAVAPPIIRQEGGLDSATAVLVLGLNGVCPLTQMRALVDRPWRPACIVVDISPRTFGRVSPQTVSALLADSAESFGGSLFTRSRERLSTSLENFTMRLLPSCRISRTPADHARAVRDGWRYGWSAYLHAYAGNVAELCLADGSVRTEVLNQTPGYRRFRQESVAASVVLITRQGAAADTTLRELLQLSRRLAAGGSRVLIVNMALAPELRNADQAVNGELYRQLTRDLSRDTAVRFIDLGADSTLAALPFYDGHHVEYPVAIRSSRRIAELLAPGIPSALRCSPPSR